MSITCAGRRVIETWIWVNRSFYSKGEAVHKQVKTLYKENCNSSTSRQDDQTTKQQRAAAEIQIVRT